MNGGTGGSALHEMLLGIPAVYGHTDVTIMTTRGISFAIFILAEALSELEKIVAS